MNRPTLRRRSNPPDLGDGTTWSHGHALTTMALRGAVIAVVGLSAVGGIGVLLDSPPPPPATATTDTSPGHSTRAEEFAENAIAQWLTATSTDPGTLPDLFGVDPGDLPESPTQVTRIGAADSHEVQPGLWSVLVAADVTESAPSAGEPPDDSGDDPSTADESSEQVTTRRYFRLAVAVDDAGGAGALGLPAPTAAPPAVDAQLAYPVTVNSGEPVAAAAAEFLTAYLTGSGPLERIVSPGSTLRAPDPPPYRVVEETQVRAHTDPGELADGEPLRIVVDGRAETPDRAVDLQYALTLTVRAGRWEVVAIDPAPARADPSSTTPTQQPPPPTPSATSTTTQ